jgi:hypothetical protein
VTFGHESEGLVGLDPFGGINSLAMFGHGRGEEYALAAGAQTYGEKMDGNCAEASPDTSDLLLEKGVRQG